MARTARMNSRIRAAGCDHGMLNRLVMCGLICEPRPSSKRPPETSCTSLAAIATVIGLRAKATMMPVPSSIRSVSPAATASASNASIWVSATQAPS